jgi:hypothetical protein
MSVNFWMEQAALERYQPEPIDDPEWFSIRAAEPFVEINLSNSNAVAIARQVDQSLLHYDEEGYVSVWGEWNMSKLDEIHARLMTLLNLQSKQEPLYLDPFISQEPGRCRVISMGRSEEYVERTLTRLLELVVVAREHQFPVAIG